MRPAPRSSRAAATLAIALACLPAPAARAFTLQIDKAGEAILPWRDSTVAFDLNYDDCLALGVTAEQLDGALDAAFSLWNSAPSSELKLKRGDRVAKTAEEIQAQTTQGNPLIVCDSQVDRHYAAPGEPAPPTNNILAFARILRVDSDRRIALAALYLNADPDKAANVLLQIAQLPYVLAHEIGHAVGLGHSQDVAALMYFDLTEKRELRLSEDDANGIAYLYPRKELGNAGLFGCGTLDPSAGNRRFPERRGPGGIDPGAFEWAGWLLGCRGAIAWSRGRRRARMAPHLALP